MDYKALIPRNALNYSVLKYIQQNPTTSVMKEKQTKSGLRLLITFIKINSVETALERLKKVADISKPLLELDDTPGMAKKADDSLPLIDENDLAAIVKRAEITPKIPAERKKTLEPKPSPELETKEAEKVAKPKKMI